MHISIQHNHVHLIIEAENRMALARGMQGFQISAAKLMNAKISVRQMRTVRRRGQVFADRYHVEVIKSPRKARHCLAYVLNNWRKHKHDRSAISRTWQIDSYSTGLYFAGWKERAHDPFLWRGPDTYDPLVVYLPRT
ncbi:MAG: transposase [Kofleriaceae bacterium]